jgi:hypothetical protein
MKRLQVLAILMVAVAAAEGPVRAEDLMAEKLPGEIVRWTWTVEPSAVSYDLAGGPLSVLGFFNATCRTAEDMDPTDTIFDDSVMPPPGTGEYLLVGADEGWGPPFGACDPAAYFCVRDATGDSFVMKLEDEADITHARNVIRGIETERIHVGATDLGGAVPWNPGWEFHIPPEAVYFFDQQIEICDASIAAVNEGGMPAGHWCPWTSEIFGELLPFGDWSGSTPEPFYCGPAM